MQATERISSKINYIEEKSDYTLQELCDILGVTLSGSDGTFDGQIENLFLSISNSAVLRYYFGLLSTPVSEYGEFDKDKDSIVGINKYKVKVKFQETEVKLTFDKFINAVYLEALSHSIDYLCSYFSKHGDDILDHGSLMKELFYTTWSEFKNDIMTAFGNDFTKLDCVELENFGQEFEKVRFKTPKISVLWYAYAFIESFNDLDLSLKGETIIISGIYSNIVNGKNELLINKILRLKTLSKLKDGDKLIKKKIQRFNKYISFLSADDKLPVAHINKSLCLYLLNKNTSLLDAYLLSYRTDYLKQLPRKMICNSNGKVFIRNDNRKLRGLEKLSKESEAGSLANLSVLEFPGLLCRFLCSKSRYDYYIDRISPWGLLRYLVFYVYEIVDRYFDMYYPFKPEQKNKELAKNIAIYNFFKNKDADLEAIETVNSIIKHTSFDIEKFRHSYSAVMKTASLRDIL